VNLLGEVMGKAALGEIRRLLAPVGFALVVDWRGTWVERQIGPPKEVAFSPETGLERCCTLYYLRVR
jgi:hypothetical protein